MPVEYWLSVGGGADGATAFAEASTTEERLALLWRHPILALPEFPKALDAAATKQEDPRQAVSLGDAALQLHLLHGALAQHAAIDYAKLTVGCGLTLLNEGRRNRPANLKAARDCFQRAAGLFGPGAERGECLLSEAMTITALAEVQSEDRGDPQRALALIQSAKPMFAEPRDIARCLMNEGNTLQSLSRSEGSEAVANLRRAIQRYREAHDLLGSDPLAAGCRMNEANALQNLAELGMDQQANLEAAIALYRQVADAQGTAENRAWCLMNEGNALSRLALLGVDIKANLGNAVARFVSARALFNESYGSGLCMIYEGTARGHVGDLGVESESNAREAIRLFQEARARFPEGQMHARCLEGEAMVRENLAALGIDAHTNLLEGKRLLRAAAVIRPSGPALATCLSGAALIHEKLAELDIEPKHNREEAVRLYGEVRAIQGASVSAGTLINEGNALRDLTGFSDGVHGKLKAMLLRQAIRRYAEARALTSNPRDLASALLNEANARQRMAKLEIEPDSNLAEAARLAAEVRRTEPDGLRAVRSLGLEGHVREVLARRGTQTELNREEAQRLLHETAGRFRERGFARHAMFAYWSRGRLLREQGKWEETHISLVDSIDMLERVRSSGTTALDRQAFMERTNQIFRDMVETCLQLCRHDDALEYAERGRSRALVDLLSLRDQTPRVPSEVAKVYHRLRRRLEELEVSLREEERRAGRDDRWQDERFSARPAAGGADSLQALLEERAAVAADLDRVETKVRQLDPDFLAAAPSLGKSDLHILAHSLGRPLLLPWIGQERSLVFVVWPSGEREQIPLPDVTAETVRAWLLGPGEALRVEGWIGAYERDRGRWSEEMEQTLVALYDRVMQPVHLWAAKSEVKRIALVVSGPLGLLPLHAATWHDDAGQAHHLLEELEILCAPSATVLQRCLGRQRADSTPVLVVGDPATNSMDRLPAAEWEATQIARTILRSGGNGSVHLVGGEEATAARIDSILPACAVAHFACHGEWNMANPLDSSLLLAGDDRLTLGHLIGHMDLGKARLVVLSACDSATGVSPGSNGEEYLGLPAGFIVAGAQAVVASLWAVEDEATGLLMTRFYQLMLEGRETPDAIRQAQLWLRGVSVEEAEATLGPGYAGAFSDRGEYPFAHPASWAAFAAFGAPVRMD